MKTKGTNFRNLLQDCQVLSTAPHVKPRKEAIKTTKTNCRGKGSSPELLKYLVEKKKKKEAIIKLVWHSQEILAQYFGF